MLESTINVKIISQECKTKYKRIQKAEKTGSLKLNNRNKSDHFRTIVYVSVDFQKHTKLHAWYKPITIKSQKTK